MAHACTVQLRTPSYHLPPATRPAASPSHASSGVCPANTLSTYGGKQWRHIAHDSTLPPSPPPPANDTVGIAFPVDDAGRAALDTFKDGTADFVQFMLDIDSEIIKLTQSGNMTVDEAGALCPADQAR